MKKLFFVAMLIVMAMSISCTPVTISKCITDYNYDGDVLRKEYKECITQTPEKMPAVHLKHQELYE